VWSLVSDIKEGTCTEDVYNVLRRIFGLKRDDMMGGWRKLHDVDLHNIYFCQEY
jgi:hypothetical protein